MGETIKNLIFSLDEESGSFKGDIITLNDLSSMMGQLRVEMDNTPIESIANSFSEWHKQVRVISELMRITTQNISEAGKNIDNISSGIFEKVIKEDIVQEVNPRSVALGTDKANEEVIKMLVEVTNVLADKTNDERNELIDFIRKETGFQTSTNN